MQLSVCTDAVYSKIPTQEAMSAVKGCGIGAVEFWNWQNKDIEAIAARSRELQMPVAAMCTSFFQLNDPACRGAYLDGLRQTLPVAQKLGCRTIITQVGADTGESRKIQHDSIVEGLRQCVPYLEEAGCRLVFEPLNTRVDHRGYYLTSSEEAAEIAVSVGSERVKILFDCYHQQIMEGDIIRRMQDILPLIGHVHAAGNPGRHQLEIGEMNYAAILDALVLAGYQDYVGLEFLPDGAPEQSLRFWAQRFPSAG